MNVLELFQSNTPHNKMLLLLHPEPALVLQCDQHLQYH